MQDATRSLEQQKSAGHDQLFRTLGVPASYKNGSGTIKSIKVIYRAAESEAAEDGMRLVSPRPVIRVRSSDLDDRDRDTATFTVAGTVWKPDAYLEDSLGLTKVFLRA